MQPDNRITKENYGTRAAEFCKRSGIESGSMPVIDVEEDHDAWGSWMLYFHTLGMDWSVSQMRKYLDKGSGKWGVPADLPWNFDLTFNPDPAALREFARGRERGSRLLPEERKEFAAAKLRTFREAIQKSKEEKRARSRRADELAETREAALGRSARDAAE